MSPADSALAQPNRTTRIPGWDSLLVAILVFAVLQITGLAEAAALPNRVEDVLRHPVLSSLIPPAGQAAMGKVGPRPGDPIGLLLNALTLGLLIAYLGVDLAVRGRWQVRVKGLILAAILLTAVFLPAAKLILLREANGPASYTHDGGVIQTEAAIQYLLAGQNPYVRDYVNTPMAEWGFSAYRTALYHYPYLPWTFAFSAPFYWTGSLVGFYDQRLVYLLLMGLMLALAPRLVEGARFKLALVAVLGLNPIMALDLIFGQNDAFVLCWVVFSLLAWQQWQRAHDRQGRGVGWLMISTASFGLACASKPTAWFFAPFFGLLLLWDVRSLATGGWVDLLRSTPRMLARAWPALAVFALLIGPYALWDAAALYDDVWRWSTGQGETGYQIWGWGASNFVLALGWVPDRFAYWPFWIVQLPVTLGMLLWFVRRQQRNNTLANACWHYGVFLLVFLYLSRFLNENYLGYLLAFLAIGMLHMHDVAATTARQAPTAETSTPA